MELTKLRSKRRRFGKIKNEQKLQKMISKIIEIIDNKQYIIVTLSSQNVTDMKEIILELDKGENSLFGVDY